MKHASFIVIAGLFLVTPAFAETVGEKTGVNSALGIAPTTEDFVNKAAISDITEIEEAQIALQKGNDQEKMFANQMIADHNKTSAELKGLVSSNNISAQIPVSLDSSAQDGINKLKNATPEDFPSEYDAMQVSAHEDAVSLFQRYADSGDNPQLKAWAAKTLPNLQHHLDMAKALNKSQ